MRKNKRLYYSAGLISIIMLPILCLITLKYNDAYKIYHSINCQIGDRMVFENVLEYLNKKQFTTVTLTGDNESDKIKIEKAQKDIKKLVSSKDSISGIKFHFGQKSEYWAFIKVLDILQIEQAYTYIIYKNDIWITNPRILKPNKNQEKYRSIICVSGRQNQYIEKSEIKIIWQKIKINYLNTIEICKKYYLPIIAYILMVFFTSRRILNEKKGIY